MFDYDINRLDRKFSEVRQEIEVIRQDLGEISDLVAMMASHIANINKVLGVVKEEEIERLEQCHE